MNRRRAGRIIARVVIGILGFVVFFPLAYTLVAPVSTGAPVTLPPVPAGEYRVYVADWGYHTSITVPQPRGWALGPPGRETAAYVEYAWGDRRFYRDSDFRPHAVFATLALPTASVAYVAGRDRPPDTSSGARAVYSRVIDGVTLQALGVELERTIRHAGGGARHPPSARVAGYAGRFHDAHGSYMWTRNCNQWTVDRLAAVQLANGRGLVIFSGQVAGRLRGFERS